MTFGSLYDYCISRPGATEGFPFGESALVFKVGGKVFALLMMEPPPRISLKCDPERAIELRERTEAVQPGYHLNKRHWNTIEPDGSLLDDEIRELIDHSYELVVASLPKSARPGD